MYCFLFNSSENQLIYYIYSIDSGYCTLNILVSVCYRHQFTHVMLCVSSCTVSVVVIKIII